ncbi:efflux RND transporter periplasmic adaptor subunit [Candidatus Accumulibacter sp. ACC003]|uniref:efflux RND transporter periplasmic adaptor subunit n=1 Tax=Candidatus Accumulibacter sp. ACC003 TaxID=2823334 RepID=UPI0025B92290|nr:efflux RND transporter periplasmic adaptor subunit [Candidatus Accumulibacter sp. ACC003]
MKAIELQQAPAQPASPHRWRRIFARALLVLTSAAIVALLAGTLPAQAQTTTAKASPVLIESAPLGEVIIHPQRELAASVIPRNESKLSAEVSGVLQRWTAEAGSAVKKGELLAEIDPVDFRLALQQSQAALDAALARLKQAEQQLKRSRELQAQGFFSQEALVQRETEVALMRSELASQQAQVAIAQRQLAKASLRAPFAGSVVERLAQTGEAVAPGSVLYVLAETGAAEVSASIAPADVAGLRRAKDLVFETRGKTYPLRLLRVAGTVSAPARTQEVRLGFAAGDGTRVPVPVGSDGRLLWSDPQPYLPAPLLVRRGEAIGVFVQQGKVARFVALPAAQEGRAVPVSLPAATRVVVRGQATLQDGVAIR